MEKPWLSLARIGIAVINMEEVILKYGYSIVGDCELGYKVINNFENLKAIKAISYGKRI